MEFAFTEEQEATRKTLRNFALRTLLPNYQKLDREKSFPREYWAKLAALGLTGLRISPEHGGNLTDFVSCGVTCEEIARGDFSCSYAVLICSLVGDILQVHGSQAVKEEWLPAMAAGERIVALSLTEPHCGSDAAALQTRAVRAGDSYVLSGEKSATSFMMDADALVLFAKTDPNARARGISALVVPTNLPGVARQSYEDMGAKAVRRGSIFLDQVAVPAENLLSAEGQGFYQVMMGFDFSRMLIALMCLGAAQQTLDETVSYVKQRTAFGQPLAKFEGVSFAVAEHTTMIEAARLLCFKGLWLCDNQLPHTKEAAMAKWLGPKVAVETIHECLLLHGHYGYTQELPVEQRLRDVLSLEIGDGTPHVQKIIISRELLGREFLPY